MVQVSVTTSVKAAGPSLPLNLTLEPESYTLHSISLTEAGGTKATDKALLPSGPMVLLAVSVLDAEGKPAVVRLELTSGHPITVDGSLLLANADAISQLVPAADREASLTNTGAKPVAVEIFTCRNA